MRRVWWALGAAACSGWTAPEPLRAADAARIGDWGDDGPLGASVTRGRAQARVTDAVPVNIVFPTDESGELAVTGAPAVVFVHGGFVDERRYEWLAAHLATRGFVTVLPEADLDLAIAEPGNGDVALDALRALAARADGPIPDAVPASGPVAAMGHSLGGVMAARQWARDEGVVGVAMLASFPAATEAVEGLDRPALSLAGSADVSALPADVRAGWDRLGPPKVYAEIDDLTHYMWTDEAEPPPDLAAVRRPALAVLDAWLAAELAGDADAAARLDAPFDHAEVEVVR